MQFVTHRTFNHSIFTDAFHFQTLYEGQALTTDCLLDMYRDCLLDMYRDCLLDMYKDSLLTANIKKARKLSSLIIGQIGDRV